MKAGLLGGMFFEDLGFRYIGPVDGHNIRQLQKYLRHGPAGRGAGAAARGDGEGARLPARRRRPHHVPRPRPVPARERLGRAR